MSGNFLLIPGVVKCQHRALVLRYSRTLEKVICPILGASVVKITGTQSPSPLGKQSHQICLLSICEMYLVKIDVLVQQKHGKHFCQGSLLQQTSTVDQC